MSSLPEPAETPLAEYSPALALIALVPTRKLEVWRRDAIAHGFTGIRLTLHFTEDGIQAVSE